MVIRAAEEQGMLSPSDDVVSVEAESNCGSGSGCVAFDNFVDMFLTVGNREQTSNAETEETESIPQQCFPTSVDAPNPEHKSCVAEVAEVNIQNDKSDETSASGESDSDCVIEYVSSIPQQCFPTSVDAPNPENDSCVAEVAEVKIQNEKSDKTSASGESDSDCVIEHVSSIPQQCFPTSVDAANPENDSCVAEVAEVKIQNEKSDKTSASRESDSDCVIEHVSSIPQQCFPTSVNVLNPENYSCIAEVVEVTIQNDKSDETSASGESDSDCVIEHASESEAYDCWPAESEGEMAVDVPSSDHAYCLSADSDQHSAVVTSSVGICQEYTPQASTNFSAHSLQADNFNVTTILPFPCLITDANTDDLCSYEHSQGNELPIDTASLLGVAAMELMEKGVSGVSGLHDENGCLMIDNSGYPVVEIVPRYDDDEVDEVERSQLSSQVPCGTADITGQSAVADTHCGNTSSDTVVAASSRRTKASIVTFLQSCLFMIV